MFRVLGKWKLIGLIILFIGIYYYPVDKYTFNELYQKDDKISMSLTDFRNEPIKTIQVNKNQISYYISGDKDSTVLFLHGMGGSYDIWWQQIQYFRERFRTVSFSYPENINSLKELSDCITSILDKEKIHRVIIVGSSLGGYLAQYMGVYHPERVIMLSLGNTFPPNNENISANEGLIRIVKWLPAWVVIKSIRNKYNKEVVPAADNSPVVKAFLNELLGEQVTKKAFINRYYCVVDTFSPKLQKTLPVQIIESDNDPLVSINLRRMLKDTYPFASVITMHNAGHFPYLNNPVEYNKRISDFISNAKLER